MVREMAFHFLTDGCRSAVGDTNVWKLFSDEYGDYNVTRDLFFSGLRDREFFLLVDGWLMFDGLRYRYFFDVTSNVYIEVQDVPWRSQRNQRVLCATSDKLRRSIRFRVWREEPTGQTTFSIRSLFLVFFFLACCEAPSGL